MWIPWRPAVDLSHTTCYCHAYEAPPCPNPSPTAAAGGPSRGHPTPSEQGAPRRARGRGHQQQGEGPANRGHPAHAPPPHRDPPAAQPRPGPPPPRRQHTDRKRTIPAIIVMMIPSTANPTRPAHPDGYVTIPLHGLSPAHAASPPPPAPPRALRQPAQSQPRSTHDHVPHRHHTLAPQRRRSQTRRARRRARPLPDLPRPPHMGRKPTTILTRGRPHRASQPRRHRRTRKHPNHLPTLQPTQRQRPKTTATETKTPKNQNPPDRRPRNVVE